MLRTRIRQLALLAAIVALIALRVKIIRAWHQPAGDGVQYFRLADELRAHGRFAFSPPPAPLVYSRLPGYPLFMWLASGGQQESLPTHIWRAAQWNVLFDVLTALLLFLAARAAGLRRAWLGAVVVLALPTLWLMSCYALTESISTLAVAATLYCAIALMNGGKLRFAVAMGLVAGVAQLIRMDALCTIPLLLYSCLKAPVAPRRRALLVGAALGCALVVFSPWPIRNLARFGAPHFAATTWRADDGTPLRTGPVQWARTWADSTQGAYFELYFVYQRPYQIDRPGAIPSQSYDDAAERQRLVTILQHYNKEGLSEAVNNEFLALAADRFSAHRLRTLVVLPFRRILQLFDGEPEYEMPMRVPFLSLPERRPWLIRIDRLLFCLAALGALLLWRSERRRLVWLMVPALLIRIALYSIAIPQAVTERYLVEDFPLFVLLLVGATSELELRLRRARAR